MNKKYGIIKIIILVISLILIFFSIFMRLRFNKISFEQLLFSALTAGGGNLDILFHGILFVGLSVGIILIIILLLKKIYIKFIEEKYNVMNKIKNKKIFKIIFYTLILLVSLISALKILDVDTYFISQTSESNLFEKYYIDPKEVNLEFPDKKRNLIYIFVESLENTIISKKNGGVVEKSYIPNLEKLALKNINFSNTDKLGGAIEVNNTNWTYAALFSQTSGIPFKMSMNTEFYQNYVNSFPGIYNLGDILKDNGYKNYFMMGSDADFGGRKAFFETHGDYKIYDYVYAKENNYIDEDYFVWWGYEDKKLFEYAKEKILKISSSNEPFNFTLLTVDTHFTDGYMDEDCTKKFDNEYANAFYCSDSKIYSFVNWLKEQDFYKNTTIIITGDHLTMQSNFFKKEDNYQRTIYNTFINSKITPKNEKNRLFSSFDMLPTTLASLGVKIEGNKLGLGVNLFSKEKTILEKMGIEETNEQISKASSYYDNVILGME